MKLSNNHNNNPEKETKDKSSSTSDFFERRKAVVESTKETFKSFNPNNCKGCHYILWIETDAITFRDLTSKDSDGLTLEQELTVCLSKIGYEISSLEVRNGGKPERNPTPCQKTEKLDVEMWLQETSFLPPPPPGKMKARITLAPDSPGALKQSEGYVIDSENAPYNIGRVIEPGDNIRRVNHIEIVDETNRVSRTHAHIGYSQKFGFYIQRDNNMTGTNVTTRIRASSNIPTETPLKSPEDRLKLQDGDIIELNKFMKLLFQIIN